MKIRKSVIVKVIIFIFILLLIGFSICKLLPVIQNLSTEQGRIEFRDYVLDSGFIGLLILFSIQFAQIFLIIIPGEPIELLAGMCYGTINGTLFILLSNLLTSSLIVFSVKFLGKRFVENFSNMNKVDKLLNSKLFKNKKNLEYILFLLFLIPGTPKDLLTYVGAILPIRHIRFIFISTIARIPSIISSTIIGSNFIEGGILFSIFLYIAIFVIVILLVLILNKFDKNKSANIILDGIIKNNNNT